MRIQVHIHPWTEDFLGLFPKALMDRYERSYPGFTEPRTIEDLIQDMDEIGVDVSVLLPIDCTVALGKRMSNEAVADSNGHVLPGARGPEHEHAYGGRRGFRGGRRGNLEVRAGELKARTERDEHCEKGDGDDPAFHDSPL